MSSVIGGFLLILILLAVITRETFVVVLLYLFVGANLLGYWWIAEAMKHITFSRKYTQKAFPGETVVTELTLTNTGLLPIIWLRIQDFYPLEVADLRSFSQVITLGPKGKIVLNYKLKARKRGYYTIGPFNIASGDLLGISKERIRTGGIDHFIVYPQVITFSQVKLSSTTPIGTLRHPQPIFEDPTRTAGKRDYQAGDSIRRIDWKATASTGQMQTKIYEPSIALDTIIFLNLSLEDYYQRTHFNATELAIVVAASLANYVITRRQSAGLSLNGFDPLSIDNRPPALPSQKGLEHLMHILEILARIQTIDGHPFIPLLHERRVHLAWGTTLMVVTGSASQPLFDELLQVRRSGLNPVIILCGEHPDHHQAALKGKLLKLPLFIIRDEKDLDLWRG